MDISSLIAAVTSFTALGASVAIPIVLFLIAWLAFRVSIGKSARAAITIGIGFVGINLLIGFFVSTIAPVAKQLVAVTGVHLVALDVGWPSAAAIAFGSVLGTVIIPVTVVVNLIYLGLRVTRTLDVDVWNYWHFAFAASLVYIATGDFWLGMLAGTAIFTITLAIADWSAPYMQEMLGVKEISLPHAFSAPYFALAWPVKWVLDRIPGLNKLHADPATIERRLGILGESPVLGAIIGFVLSVVARVDYTVVAAATIGMAAVMLILPRMVRILMEGLTPLADAIRDSFMKRYGGKRELYIGLDSAIAIGHPTAIAASLILIPIFIAESVLVPWNKILLLADLTVIPFMVCMTVPVFKYDVVKTVINGAIINIFGLIAGSSIIDIFTKTAKSVGFPIPSGTLYISSICDGTNFLDVLPIKAVALGSYALYVILGAVTVVFACIGWYAERRRTQAAARVVQK